jgi:hypothetical protein
MKKYSDYFSGLKRLLKRVGNRIAATALFMVAAITMAFAQEPYHFIEGSTHSFSVEKHEGNKFEWAFRDEAFNLMPDATFEFIEGQFDVATTIQFKDMNRSASQNVYLAVTETRPEGCSTTRAINIILDPNNMYLEFASADSKECFSIGDYQAPLKIGLNFLDKAAGLEIPKDYFPLKVTYTIQNKTEGTLPILGNKGDTLSIEYNPLNDYYLLVSEAVGLPDRTTEYEIAITSVTARYNTDITQNSKDIRIQIRVINHLPQSGNMDMALAYYIIK